MLKKTNKKKNKKLLPFCGETSAILA